ncbi:AMP-binding enzyme, partial [Nosocomiicoccus massiliensis]|uniref:AMP-binding enzyme n=1 Tax=Nosocomiicoccus massiliensis TaxID=1232430 RepID=UPI000594AC66
DIAEVKDGYLYILDRRDDLIISGGENIYPKEIEDIVLQYTDLKTCVVVKKEDEEWGQVPVLLIEENIDERALINIFNTHLARYKHPKEIIVVKEIKYTPSGKISRKLNREAYITTSTSSF